MLCSTPAYPGYVDRKSLVLRYYSIPLKTRTLSYWVGTVDINFRSTIKNIPFDIVHAHCPFTSGIVALQIAKEEQYSNNSNIPFKIYDDFKQVLKIDAFAKFCTCIVMDFDRVTRSGL